METLRFTEEEFHACCGSTKFAKEMMLASPFTSLQESIAAARDIWYNKVDMVGWLEAFSYAPPIGKPTSLSNVSETATEWSKGEQSTALRTADDGTLQELSDWNDKYREKFGFVFLIFATGKSSAAILGELKKRYHNRPLVEFQNASDQQIKITELRLAKLFKSKTTKGALNSSHDPKIAVTKLKGIENGGGIIEHTSEIPSAGSRASITTHVLDVSQGCPAAGVEVRSEMWKDTQSRPLFGDNNDSSWIFKGSSTTGCGWEN